jgi:CBS domain-containing protein
MTPSQRLRAHLRAQMQRHEPFSRLEPASMEALLDGVRESYHAPGEVILGPQAGAVERLRWVRSGAVRGTGSGGEVFEIEAGEVFPVGAVLAERAVTSRYEAVDDVFCLEIDASVLRETARRDPTLADFLQRRMRHLLALAARATQAVTASQVLEQQSFEAPLSTLVGREPVAIGPDASLLEGLERMSRERVGSVVVVDEEGHPLGILTQQDLLGRIVLHEPAPPLSTTPMRAVMSAPVLTLEVHERVADAVLAMSRHGIRHVPLTRSGRLVAVVSERDLFALQKQSLGGLGSALRGARDTATLQALASQVRAYARRLQAQGLAAPTLTALVSHLNDLLCTRLVELQAASHGLDLRRACWVAFGSEGRGEQTVATDQDNGLVLADGVDEPERERWRVLGRSVNEALDACGFPLCKGGIMAGEARCCLRQGDWLTRFEHWMSRGEPQDLLEASIFFDMRPIAGDAALVAPLRRAVTAGARQHPLFLRLLAENSLRLKPALAWHGGLDTEADGGRRQVDLKLQGTAVFVDAARLYALAAGVEVLGTRKRLVQAGESLGVPEHERQGWASAFEVLQMLRLRVQVQAADGQATNRVDVESLDDIDRQLLKEAMKVGKRLQQRVSLDWLRA